MPQFNAYPALQARTFDLPAIMRQAEQLKGQRPLNRLREFQLQQAQGEVQRQGQLRGLMPGVGAEPGLGPNAQEALGIDPSMLGELMKIPKAQRDKAKEQAVKLGNLALGVLTAPPVQRAAMWSQAREAAIASGANPQNVPELYDQGVEVKLRNWVAQAGQIKTLLDQVPDVPPGYQRTEGGLEFTPGGPADPAQVGRLAAAKSQGEGLTVAQKRENAEIQQARAALDREGLSHEDVMRIAKSQRDTGRDNPEYSPFINGRVRQATRRKYGDDPDYAATYGRYLTPGPEFSDPAGMRPLPPGVSTEQP